MPTSLEVMRTEMTAAMASGRRGRGAADALCTTCVGLFDVDGAALSLISDGASSGTYGSSNEASRRLDEYQFTFGEGPCLDAVSSRAPVLVPNLDSPREQRWPVFREAVLVDGIRSVFAPPIMITSVCVGALDLFRERPGPLEKDALAGAMLAQALVHVASVAIVNERTATDRATVNAQLEHALSSRIVVEQAKGVLALGGQLEMDVAFAVLRRYARDHGRKLSAVAREIVRRELSHQTVLDHGRATAIIV